MKTKRRTTGRVRYKHFNIGNFIRKHTEQMSGLVLKYDVITIRHTYYATYQISTISLHNFKSDRDQQHERNIER